MPNRALNRRNALELGAILLVAVGGIVLGVQQGRTSEGLDDLNRTVLGTQVIRCVNDLNAVSRTDPVVQAICRRALDQAREEVMP